MADTGSTSPPPQPAPPNQPAPPAPPAKADQPAPQTGRHRRSRPAVPSLAVVVVAAAVLAAVAVRSAGPPTEIGLVGRAGPLAAAPTTTEAAPPATAPPATVAPTSLIALPLPGCPPPPRPPGSGGVPYVPPHLVPEDQLPAAQPPPAISVDTTPLAGKGMWIWKYLQSEGGDADAIVARATAAGLRQLWIRVGDSQDGFYGASALASLVPKAHRAGLAVIGWGFPYLHDPASDAAWSIKAATWKGPDGSRLDGFSPDIELSSEGVILTERRITVYLGLLRPAAPDRLLVATVYPPADKFWNGTYPYHAIAPYVDAFAPMVYWGCTEPGAAAQQAVDRLSTLKPVHIIGQGYDAGPEGGRVGAPSAEETTRFLDVARREGAIGGSFWVWQFIGDEQWSALARFPWSVPDPTQRRSPA